MKTKKVLLIGYGSIGKRHSRNLIELGIKPYILTKYPDDLNAVFLSDINEIKNENINYCIISSTTARHLDDLKKCLALANKPKHILIEKPLESLYSSGKEIRNIAEEFGISTFVAYNLRFLEAFKIIRNFVKEQKNTIRIVEVVAGQDLKEWRPFKDYTESYSAHREQGGGVDLDLSHEIDYILWLFGSNFKDKIIYRNKISNLKINSPDIFKLILDYNTFIVDIKNNGKKIVIGVPNTFTLEWLENKYTEEIKKALRKLVPEVSVLEFQVAHLQKEGFKEKNQEEYKPLKHFEFKTPQRFSKTKDLNSYFTFQNFVVGENNRFAHAAALAVSKQPGKSYNPLFIYGGVGLGKTHLVQAIAWEIKKNSPQKKILYFSFEKFATDFINHVKTGRMEEFKKKYRQVDVLLVDDIQFISGKERTQDEFFHTFNNLYQNQKQIVLTSDRPPKSIPLLEERLRSRFEWGMIVDISPPDYETRLAILKHKNEERGLNLPQKILEFIARQIQNNIRELEGALNKVEAYLSLTQKELTLTQTKKLLESLIKNKKTIDPEKIIKTICDYYQIAKKELLSHKREQRITLPRQIIMYLLRHEFNYSFPKIAEILNYKDHSIVIWNLGNIV